ncbi:hypothetical protein CPC08DRAFT_425630 [Agrocybe pediades]|nr:hypothetical protein CPC08DRAFT_425630 [Agrocybe pediades]
MLNPPLSTLPYDVLVYIVDHVAALSADKDLRALCLTHRVFTYACQKWIFRTLRLYGGGKISVDDQLQTKGAILPKAPLLSRWIRKIQLTNVNNQLFWLLSDPRFVSILQMLALSAVPPSELGLAGTIFEDDYFLATRLSQSFLPWTLTTLVLRNCQNVPLAIITMLPRLRKLELDLVEAGTWEGCFENDDEIPAGKCSPAIEVFDSRQSHTMLA